MQYQEYRSQYREVHQLIFQQGHPQQANAFGLLVQYCLVGHAQLCRYFLGAFAFHNGEANHLPALGRQLLDLQENGLHGLCLYIGFFRISGKRVGSFADSLVDIFMAFLRFEVVQGGIFCGGIEKGLESGQRGKIFFFTKSLYKAVGHNVFCGHRMGCELLGEETKGAQKAMVNIIVGPSLAAMEGSNQFLFFVWLTERQ